VNLGRKKYFFSLKANRFRLPGAQLISTKLKESFQAAICIKTCGSCLKFSTHRLMLVMPQLAKSPIAKFRRLAMFAGPCLVRIVERSSPNVISFE